MPERLKPSLRKRVLMHDLPPKIAIYYYLLRGVPHPFLPCTKSQSKVIYHWRTFGDRQIYPNGFTSIVLDKGRKKCGGVVVNDRACMLEASGLNLAFV